MLEMLTLLRSSFLSSFIVVVTVDEAHLTYLGSIPFQEYCGVSIYLYLD